MKGDDKDKCCNINTKKRWLRLRGVFPNPGVNRKLKWILPLGGLRWSECGSCLWINNLLLLHFYSDWDHKGVRNICKDFSWDIHVLGFPEMLVKGLKTFRDKLILHWKRDISWGGWYDIRCIPSISLYSQWWDSRANSWVAILWNHKGTSDKKTHPRIPTSEERGSWGPHASP